MIKTASFAVAALAAAGLAVACGGSSTGPSSSGGSNSGGGTSGGGSTSTNTITITSAGVSPKDITVSIGSRVTFVNNDSIGHDMNSDPHPEHTTCGDGTQFNINVGNILAGQSRSTQNLNAAKVCTYHDHNQPSNTALQGTIRIQ
jgi:plastocyanin